MQSYVITGEQQVGKSTLAKLICSVSNSIITNISRFEDDIKKANLSTLVVIIDEISSEKDIAKFKDISTRETLSFRKPYSKNMTSITPVIIGVFQSEVNKEEFRHSIVFQLK